MLKVAALTVSYPQHGGGRRAAVRDVDLAVAPGEIVGLVGESGCGKSSLARAVVGLQPVDHGEVLLDGVDPRTLDRRQRRAHRRRAQMVFQDPSASLDPHRTVAATVAEALTSSSRTQRRQRVDALLRTVGLDPALGTRRASQLSGGQCQRVAIARALAAEPRLLVCDEPVTALDVSVQARVLNLLMDLRDDLGMSCLFITHDLTLLAQLADRVAVMHDGQIVETRPTRDLLVDPGHPQTVRLLDAVPRFSWADPLTGESA